MLCVSPFGRFEQYGLSDPRTHFSQRTAIMKNRPISYNHPTMFSLFAADHVLTVRTRARRMERVKGIEPSYDAWEAPALPLSYTRVFGSD